MFSSFNGKVISEKSDIQVSPFLNATVFGVSVFETLRTYNQEVFELDLHLDRLESSLKILDINPTFSKKSALRVDISAEILVLLSKNKERVKNPRKNGKDLGLKANMTTDFRIKIFVCEDFYWIEFSELVAPDENIYQEGVVVGEVVHERIFPEAKYPNPAYPIFMQRVKQLGVFELLLFDRRDNVLEGNISNVFMFKEGVLYTPKDNILKGVTRDRIIKSAEKLGLVTREQEIPRNFLLAADEIFISNTTKELVPVRKWGDWGNQDFKNTQALHRIFKNLFIA